MYDVYEGTVGFLFNPDGIIEKLNRYIINTSESLSYEVMESKSKVVIITGKNEDEKALPAWSHVLIFNDVHGKNVLAVDMRPYMKGSLNDMITVTEKLQDSYNGKLQLMRLVFNKLLLDDNVIWYNMIKPLILESFGSIFSGLTSVLLYDESNRDRVSFMSKLHYVTINKDKSDIGGLDDVILLLPRKDIEFIKSKNELPFYNAIKAAYGNDEFNIPSRSINNLVTMIKTSIGDNRSSGLTPDLYIQAMSRGFFSMDTKNLAVSFTEHIPTTLAVLFMILTEGINSKSTFRRLINNNSRNTKPKELVKALEKVYNDELAG